jgi:hypothetical protein
MGTQAKLLSRVGAVLMLFLAGCGAKAQSQRLTLWESAPEPNKQRVKYLSIAEGAALTGAYIGLSQLWYSKESQRDFHFFNDNSRWLQMDKVGHAMTGYYVGYLNAELYLWAGLPRRQAYWIGAGSSLLFLTGIEVLDGFSDAYGFSYGDMVANAAGSALLIGQEYLWQEQHLVMKFSFSRSPYTNTDPTKGGWGPRTNLLGDVWYEEILKDYNGQTYWLSANINGLTGWDKWPAWLNLAAGYGADGMLWNTYRDEFGDIRPLYLESKGNPNPPTYQRQFYLAPDIDLRKIPVKNKALKTVFKALNFIKFPMPTYEINAQGANQFHWLFF